MDFKRALSLREFEMWKKLQGELNEVSLGLDSTDFVLWALEKKGHYSSKFLYIFLTDGGCK